MVKCKYNFGKIGYVSTGSSSYVSFVSVQPSMLETQGLGVNGAQSWFMVPRKKQSEKQKEKKKDEFLGSERAQRIYT